jgi:putative NADH-flavin reductase
MRASKSRKWFWIIGTALILAVSVKAIMPGATARGLNAQNSVAAPVLTASSVALRVLVIGGTSGIGLEFVKLAAARGHSVTVMARHMAASLPTGVRFVGGDILDASAVANAIRDQNAVVTSISTTPSRKPTTLFSAGMANVLAAMNQGNVARLVAVTGIGAGDSRGHGGFGYDRVFMPLMMRSMYDDKTVEEASIRSSGTDWTLVRPGFLNSQSATGQFRVVRNMEGVTSGSISRADVAIYIVAALEGRLAVHQAVLLTN